MSYYIHDISDTDRIYQFKKEQLENVDCMEMINLHDRGATSEYTLPMDMQKGKQLTIINRDFGVDYDDYYCGVEIVLNLDRKQDRASYFFYFKNQSASFVFNGSFWIPLFPKPLPIIYPNFIDNQTMEYGYLDLQDYLHPDRKELFGNLDLKNFDVTNLLGRFFRQGDYGIIGESSFEEHTHPGKYIHNHNINKGVVVFDFSIFSKSFIKSKKIRKAFKKLKIPILKEEYLQQIYSDIITYLIKEKSIKIDFESQTARVLNENLIFVIKDFLKYKICYLQLNLRKNKVLNFISKAFIKKRRNLSQEDLLISENFCKEFFEKYNLNRINLSEKIVIHEIIEIVIIQIIENYWNTFITILQDIAKKILPVWSIVFIPFITKYIEQFNKALAQWIRDNQKYLKELVQTYIIDKPNELKKIIIDFLITKDGLDLPKVLEKYLEEYIVLIDSTLLGSDAEDPNNIPVFLLIDNQSIKDLIPEKNDQPYDLQEDLKTIYGIRKSTGKIELKEKAVSTETRPKNIQGQYIVKAW